MKGLLTCIAIAIAMLGLSAQSFSVNTTYVSFTGDANWNEVPSPTNFPAITNVSNDTLNMRWIREEQNISGWWRSSLCRASYCYAMGDDSGSFTMLPGGVDMLYVHIYPYGYTDTGNVVVKLFNVDSPADSVRIMFHADLSTGIEEHIGYTYFHTEVLSHEVRFSPLEAGIWSLTDVTGRVLQSEATKPGEMYEARVLTSGIYLFTFVNADGITEVRKLIL